MTHKVDSALLILPSRSWLLPASLSSSYPFSSSFLPLFLHCKKRLPIFPSQATGIFPGLLPHLSPAKNSFLLSRLSRPFSSFNSDSLIIPWLGINAGLLPNQRYQTGPDAGQTQLANGKTGKTFPRQAGIHLWFFNIIEEVKLYSSSRHWAVYSSRNLENNELSSLYEMFRNRGKWGGGGGRNGV